MPVSKIDQLLIEKYFDKTLTDAEKISFNQRRRDTDFADELRLYEQAISAIYAFGDSQLKALLQEEETKITTQTKTTDTHPQSRSYQDVPYKQPFLPKIGQNFKSSHWIAMAASFLFLVSVGYWFFNQNKDANIEDVDKLFAIHYKPYKYYDDPNVRTADTKNTAKTDLEQAFLFYQNGKYEQALTYFEKIVPPNYLDESGLFYAANAYLATNKAEKAIPILEKLSQNTASQWQKQAEWYLALAYLKTKNKKATPLFEKIKSDSLNLHRTEAGEIKIEK